MRSLSTPVVLLISGVLALLLIFYVFTGTSGRDREDAPRCVSQQGLEQVKNELFRRAASVRGTNDAAFAAVARYSVVRSASRMYRKLQARSDKVSCTGTIALDLPPGVAVIGGRRSLTSKVAYALEPAGGGAVKLLTLSKADAIVVPLAAIGQAAQATQPIAEAPPPQAMQPSAVAGAQPPAPPAAAPARPSAPARAQAPKPAPPQRTAAAPQRKPAPQAPARTVPIAPAPAPAAAARPSFNCRYAKTRGEIAVCGSPELASLDRQMAGQFYSALWVARPGQRAMLQRSRSRFLAYRDSCGSAACIAQAYRARMQEIAQIMNGRW